MGNPLYEFATEMSDLIGQHIGPDHIHASTGRYFYTQMPKAGSPMLLHHYQGPFFIDLNRRDYDRIIKGEITPHMYIYSANWLVGYFWGGSSMIGGSYYQPMDIVLNKEKVRRYLKILACRGNYRSTGYYPSSDECKECGISDCPFSRLTGDWSKELKEEDPRINLFNKLLERFENEYPPFTLRGFLCGDIPTYEIWLRPNRRFSSNDEYSFVCYASSTLIQSILMREVLLTECDINDLKFKIQDGDRSIVVNDDVLRNCFKDDDFPSFDDSSFEEVFKDEKASLGKRIVSFLIEHF